MSDFETLNVAQQRAKQRAEQDACEQAGVYVKSFSRSVNAELVDYEIIAMTSDIFRKANADQERQIAELKRQLADATTQQQKDQLTQQFADEDKIFLSNRKSDEAWKLWERKDFSGAAKLFDEAVNLNPDNANAWFGRGTAYGNLGQHERAIADYDKALQINLNYTTAKNNREVCLKALGR